MSNKTRHVTADDVASLSRKLEEWGEGLPAAERALLQLLVDRAAGAPIEEVEGHAFHNPSLDSMVRLALGPLGSAGFGTANPILMAKPRVWSRRPTVVA